ncbi:MAG: aldo/keto reductase [Oscillospiraceae bacterium]|nr:aldo/keto reductase [Oscillospiraceae bacterium]
MRYRTDPKSKNSLSALGFGCMRFPRGAGAKTDLAKSEKLVMSAVAAGVNYFDTAYIYPGSERTLGKILARNPGTREKIFIATKLPHAKCKTHADFGKIFTEQLGRLGTGYIDYYLIHNLTCTEDWDRLREMGIENWFVREKAAGRIRRAGFSFHGAQNAFMELLDVFDWDFCMIQYNYMNENYQAGRAGLLRANEKGLPVIVMEPLLGGKLATGLPKKAARVFENADSTLSPATWALRWLWDQGEVTVVLSGMAGESQLAENINAAKTAEAGSLTAREADAIKEAASVIRESYKIPCTGCNYCLPCPRGVNIPGCFAAYNTSYASGYITGMAQYMTSTGAASPSKSSGAYGCTSCRACEKHCPQKIAIADALTKVTKRMEPIWVRAAMRLARKFM